MTSAKGCPGYVAERKLQRFINKAYSTNDIDKWIYRNHEDDLFALWLSFKYAIKNESLAKRLLNNKSLSSKLEFSQLTELGQIRLDPVYDFSERLLNTIISSFPQ